MHLPGDDLRALPQAAQVEVLRRSVRQAAQLEAAGVGHPIDTTGRSVESIAGDVLALVRLGVPERGHGR
jgi:hypothetical protein